MSRLAVALEPRNERGDAIATGGSSLLRRSIITLVVVATTLVSDARSKMVSSVIGSTRGHERAVADRLLIQHAVAAADEHDGAGQLLLGDRLLHQRLDRVELFRSEIAAADGLGLRREDGNRDEREQDRDDELFHARIIDGRR